MKDFRAVIFDMDGVIVNSEPHHERAFHDVIHELGYDGLGGLKFADYVGRSDFELWVDFIARNKPVQTLEELLARKRQRVMEVMREDLMIYGTAFARRKPDGTFERVDPTDVYIKPKPHTHVGSPSVDRGETCLDCGKDMYDPIHSTTANREAKQ